MQGLDSSITSPVSRAMIDREIDGPIAVPSAPGVAGVRVREVMSRGPGPVPSAPGVAGVRVREVMSRGPGPRTGAPPPEGVDVGYPPTSPDVPQGVLRQLQGRMFWWRAGGERKAAETFGENV